MKIMASVVVLVAFLGCGGGGGTASVFPTVHEEHSGNQRLATGTTLPIGPFTMPGGATMTYIIVDMPTGFGSDTMDFQITSATGSGPAYGERTNANSLPGVTTSALPADDYVLLARCRNISDECFFGETISSTY
jgi:hypothetical protein